MSLTSITQKLLPNWPENIAVRNFSRRHAGMAAVHILEDGTEPLLGLAMKRSAQGRAAQLAIATVDEIFLISAHADRPTGLLSRHEPFERLLRSEGCTITGFELPRIAIRIAQDMKLRLRGIDLSTAFVPDTRNPSRPSHIVADRVCSRIDRSVVDDLWADDHESVGHRELCLRAWLAACAAKSSRDPILQVSNIDTGCLTPPEIVCLGELVRQTYVLEDARPKETSSEFDRFKVTHDGTLELQNARYKTRIRNSRQTVIMTNESGEEFFGQPSGSRGRMTNIRFTGQTLAGTLRKVRVVGRPELTNPEKARDELLLLVLQVQFSLDSGLSLAFPTLNASQKQVASRMISAEPLVVVHGPPGTGKTTTISAAVGVWDRERRPAWIVAHSNVAVKNIAETLFKKDVNFKIIVSKEFHFEWHEHIYHKIENQVLRSDDFMACKDAVSTERLLDRTGVFKVVPVERLVVDEASQIKIEDFLPIFQKFQKTLQKACFFGDPKQLPPYGKEDVPELRTIFDLPHLEESGGFLDTQYRMPVPLGHFISRSVYGGRLKSEHTINNPTCISFVDTSNGTEKRSGFSWTNDGEIHAIVNLVKTYYRYKDFCIITPYDAQRAAIERQLKNESLPWERVFNVDSFQGNEAEFVIVSVVRSGREPGFLSSINRMNVLLTRCKKGLIIVTSRSFLQGGGSSTLLGLLERHWMDTLKGTWVNWREVSGGTADMPGAPGSNRGRSLLWDATWAPSSHSTIPSVSVTRTFDVKSLFRPVIPKMNTEKNVPRATPFSQPAFSYSPTEPSSPSVGTPVSSSSNSQFSSHSAIPSVRPASSSNHLNFRRWSDYDRDFPSLPSADLSQWNTPISSNDGHRNLHPLQPTISSGPAAILKPMQRAAADKHTRTSSAQKLDRSGSAIRLPRSLLPRGAGESKPKARCKSSSPVVLQLSISQKEIDRTRLSSPIPALPQPSGKFDGKPSLARRHRAPQKANYSHTTQSNAVQLGNRVYGTTPGGPTKRR